MLGFAAALRRSELVALDVEDLAFDLRRGLLVTIRASKTDQKQAETQVDVPRARETICARSGRSRTCRRTVLYSVRSTGRNGAQSARPACRRTVLGRVGAYELTGLLDDSRLGRATMDAATVAAAGYAAMRAGRATVMPGLGTKAMRAAVAMSPSKRLTGLVSGYFVTRR